MLCGLVWESEAALAAYRVFFPFLFFWGDLVVVRGRYSGVFSQDTRMEGFNVGRLVVTFQGSDYQFSSLCNPESCSVRYRAYLTVL
ncbi:hypothetical protein J3F83DRAFT_739084 [Trichoderma novae-zelandiae]